MKKFMKKTGSFVIASMMLVGLMTGCGSGADTANPSSGSTGVPSQA